MKKLLQILFLLLIVNCSLSIVQAQWVQQSVPVTKPITGIKFIDSLKGWACTSWGSQFDTAYIMNTTNSGTNWNIQFRGALSFNGLTIINDTLGYACGGTGVGKVYKTTNAGTNWLQIASFGTGSFSDIYFVNKDSGYISGAVTVELYRTTDGGQNWTNITSGVTQQVNRLFFLNYTTGFCGANFFLYKTTNAGANWVLNGNFSGNPEGIFFFNENTGWLGLQGAMIASTTNGGINWNVQHPFPTVSDDITDMFFVNNNIGWAGTGWFQKILKTTNGGINWGYQVVPSDSKRISVVDSSKAWSADLGISRTTSGGGFINYLGIRNVSTQTPSHYALYQNYPNPFNPSTKINFDIKNNTNMKLIVFDVLGRELTILVNDKLNAGSYEYTFNAVNLPSGIYFYVLQTENYRETKKMILIK